MLGIYTCLMQPADGKEKVLASNIIILETVLQCFKKVTIAFMLLDLCQAKPTPSAIGCGVGHPFPPILASESDHKMCLCSQ